MRIGFRTSNGRKKTGGSPTSDDNLLRLHADQA
jgi:hypothetical protein